MRAGGITGRDNYILAEALTFAILGLSRLPEESRPESNIEDMKAMLAKIDPAICAMAEPEVARWLRLVAWNVRVNTARISRSEALTTRKHKNPSE